MLVSAPLKYCESSVSEPIIVFVRSFLFNPTRLFKAAECVGVGKLLANIAEVEEEQSLLLLLLRDNTSEGGVECVLLLNGDIRGTK